MRRTRVSGAVRRTAARLGALLLALLVAGLAAPVAAEPGGDPDQFWGEVAQPGFTRYRLHLAEGRRLAAQDPPRWAPAISALQRAVALLPGRPEAHLELGRAHERSRHCPLAVPHLRRALAAGLEPGDARAALLLLGDCERTSGQFREALASYQRALEHVLQARQQSQDEALRQARLELARGWRPTTRPQSSPALDADEVELRRRIGDALVSQGRLDEAEGSYRMALGIDERHAFSWLGLSVALVLKERFGDAHEALKRALQAETSEARLIAGRGVLEGDPQVPLLGVLLASARGRVDEAVRALRPILEKRPPGPSQPQLQALMAELEARQKAGAAERKPSGPARRR